MMQLILLTFVLIRTGLVSSVLLGNILKDGVSSTNDLIIKLQEKGIDVRLLATSCQTTLLELCTKANVYINSFAVNTCVSAILNAILPPESGAVQLYYTAKNNASVVDPTGGLTKLFAKTSLAKNEDINVLLQLVEELVKNDNVFTFVKDNTFAKANPENLFSICASALAAFVFDPKNADSVSILSSKLGVALFAYANETEFPEDVKKEAVFKTMGILVTGYFLNSALSNQERSSIVISRSKDSNYSKLTKEYKDTLVNYPAKTYPAGADADFEIVLRTLIQQFITCNTLF